VTYTINKSDNTVLANIADGTINDTSSSIKLIGKNSSSYGESINENFVHILENFASTVQPINPLVGQVWFDKSEKRAKIYLGTNIGWNRFSITHIGTSPPATNSVNTGDLWYDETNSELKVYTNNNWITITQGAVPATVRAKNILDNASNGKAILEFVVNTEVVAVVSSYDKFVPQTGQAIPDTNPTQYYHEKFPLIFKGITLNNSNANDNENNYKYNGIASSAYYADLAERYHADIKINPGYLVKVGGINEITMTDKKGDSVFGVISEKPGLELNANAGNNDTHPYVALIGRVTAKIAGDITKGDYIMPSDIQGVACKWYPEYPQNSIIGISLENLDNNVNQISDLKIVIKKSV